MARYGLPSERAFGISMGVLQREAKRIGKSHGLALALWKTGWYEARILATLVDEPGRVTPAQMDRWARDFDSWGICDTACCHLFDRTPHALAKVALWARRDEEFVRRAGFALLAALALHEKTLPDAAFMRLLPLVEGGATDERNFVKKGVSWALRAIGHRNLALHAAAVAAAGRLAASDDRAARWVGMDALRDLTRPAVVKKVRAK
jgi:3-methyladenine DNA glycosylase AlkD